MEDQIGALGLVLNALVLLNTRYMDAALTGLRSDGVPRLAKLLRVPTPADRVPGQPGRPGTSQQDRHQPQTMARLRRLRRPGQSGC